MFFLIITNIYQFRRRFIDICSGSDNSNLSLFKRREAYLISTFFLKNTRECEL